MIDLVLSVFFFFLLLLFLLVFPDVTEMETAELVLYFWFWSVLIIDGRFG